MLGLTELYAYFRLIRLEKPVGILLLLCPTYWALWLVSRGLPDSSILLVFTLGAFLMRSIGCIINDFVDKDFDGYVSRTRDRPFPKGEVTEKGAKILFFLLLIIAFMLVLSLNQMTILLSTIGLLLVWIYPFTKRFSYFPQFFLGLSFSWPILMVYAAVSESFPLECWLLFLVNIIWSIIYDTQYAMVDRDDDIKIGIKSTAIIFSRFDKLIIGILQIFMLFVLFCIGEELRLKEVYFISLLFVLGLFLYQQKLIIHRQPELCFKAFITNKYVGLSVFIGILINYF